MQPLMETEEFRDKLFEGKLTRRQAHNVLASFGIAVSAMPLTTGAWAGSEDPVFFTWGGYDIPEFAIHYAEKHGSQPNYVLYADEEEAFNKMRAGFQPDMTLPSFGSVPRWADAGFLAPIDKSMLSNWDDMLEPLKNMPGIYVDDELVFCPQGWGQTSVMFRADLAPEYEQNQSWGILWDPKYQSRLSVLDALAETLPIAAIYAGVDDPFDLSPDDVARVRDLLEQQMKLLRFMSSDMTSLSQALVSGELVAAMGWSSLIWRVRESAEEGGIEGARFVWMKPKEGALTWVDGLSIHPHSIESGMYEKCHEIIDSYISPEAGYYQLTEWYVGVPNSKVYENEAITEELLEGMGLSKDIDSFLASGVYRLPMANEEELAIMFEEVKAGY
jgi:spermidine/putrescine transport system substrate-binding protein